MTTKLGHPQVVPLRKLNAKNTATNRKSAVQMLQETKAFYVKSETVLDKKQEFRPGKASENSFKNFGQREKIQKIADKNNKVQDKLRILLDFDQVDSRCSKSAFKSLPDLHFPQSYSSEESSVFSFDIKENFKSSYRSQTQPRFISVRSFKSGECNLIEKSKNIDGISSLQKHSKIYASFRETKSCELFNLRKEEFPNSHKRQFSNNSFKSHHNFSSKNSQLANSGRQSKGGSTGLQKLSSLQKYCLSSQSTSSDSGTEDDIHFLFKLNENSDLEKKRPILRSKSDISYKYCVTNSQPLSPPHTIEKLEGFFDHLGMNAIEYNEFVSHNSRGSSPVFFSSVSSLDSCVDITNWGVPEPCKIAEYPSIVERNARIIKWLYNCRKTQKKVFNEKKNYRYSEKDIMERI